MYSSIRREPESARTTMDEPSRTANVTASDPAAAVAAFDRGAVVLGWGLALSSGRSGAASAGQ